MNASNLGIVFGPTLMWQKNADAFNDMMSNLNTGDVIAYLIDSYHKLFPSIQEEEKEEQPSDEKQNSAEDSATAIEEKTLETSETTDKEEEEEDVKEEDLGPR